MGRVRGVRFSQPEEKLIEEFLRKNSFLDFSTLAKIAILDFIKAPRLSLTPVKKPSRRENKDVRPIS
jgi:hypothetical protein